MLLFYLAYFASLLETSDDKENPRASNRARRKKIMRLSGRVMKGYREFSSLLLQSSINYTTALFTIPNIILSPFPCILFLFPLTTVIVGLKRDHITGTNTSAHPTLNDGGMASTERAFLT